LHQIALDDSSDERGASVGVAEVEASSHRGDAVASDDPAPGGSLGGDPVVLLRAMMVHERAALDADVVNAGAARVETECAIHVLAVDGQVLDRNEARPGDLDGVAARAWIGFYRGGRPAGGAGDGDPSVAGPVEPRDAEVRVVARGEVQRVA